MYTFTGYDMRVKRMINFKNTLTTEAIVIWRKKLKNYSKFTLISYHCGLITCTMDHKRLQRLKNASYLTPFSKIYITINPNRDHYHIEQIDGITMFSTMERNLESIAYTSMISELILKLTAKEDMDTSLYELVNQFSQIIHRKSIKLASLIMGWHLLMLAGFTPDREAILSNNGLSEFWKELAHIIPSPITSEVQSGLLQVLTYQWNHKETINLNKSVWQNIEFLLYAYAAYQLNDQLQSVQFLKDIVL